MANLTCGKFHGAPKHLLHIMVICMLGISSSGHDDLTQFDHSRHSVPLCLCIESEEETADEVLCHFHRRDVKLQFQVCTRPFTEEVCGWQASAASLQSLDS